jgi:hypothetical protein
MNSHASYLPTTKPSSKQCAYIALVGFRADSETPTAARRPTCPDLSGPLNTIAHVIRRGRRTDDFSQVAVR